MDESIALGLDMSCVALTEQEDAAAAAADVNFLRDAKETMNKNGGIVVGGDITVNDLSEPEEERPPEEEAERAAAAAHLLDTDFPETEDLLDAAGIFECVNLPAFEELQELPVPHGAAAASSATASASSSSASVSSPSTSWMQKQEEGACFTERHSSCAPSADQDPNLSSDSATSSSLANSIKTEPPTTENCLGYDSTEKIDLLEELENLEFLGSSWDIPDSSCLDGLQDVPDQTTAEEIAMPKENASATSDELPKVFFEWLKSNRDSISPEDLRRIKLKKSTIEQAAKHLGGGTKGMLTLLKLILAWVQIHHLERKRKLRESGFCYNIPPFLIDGLSNNSTSSASVPLQVPYDANLYDPSLFPMDGLHAAKYRRNAGPRYLGDASAINGGAAFDNILQRSAGLGLGLGLGIPSSDATNAVSSSPSWQMLHPQPGLCNAPNLVSSSAASLIPSVQPHLGSEFLSAGYRSGTPAASTKEARKNRMARQRRSLAHHHHHHRQWAAANSSLNPQHCSDALNFSLMQQLPQRQNAFMQSDRRQGWKPEKNLKFLLQKVLKQSDVGGLGRIVLPKKEAEAELPKLEARDGITITMEDITTSRVWSMRYRFWPNNKSRMYLLENTGDFVRSNNLQEGDFIVIFLDTKTGKYMIRGVKVPRSDTNTNTTTTAVATAATATAANSSNSNTSNSSRSACGSSKLTDGHASKVANISPSYASSTPHPSPVTTHPFSDSFSSSKPSSSVSAATATATATDSSSFPQPKIPSSASPKPDPTLERVPSIESGDLTIEEIMDLVDSPDENHDADADADQDPNRDA